ncbi:MAG TPA: tRNA (adenosine(37)-N6)-dimethylallyltransferase MiaA [Candidatus Saccharimonadales bacterium]|nr:tRNA (adenosine(37)-N6)-dimethylallyltransferase MiaA [Candidatus Saccharimonadales bacterium]
MESQSNKTPLIVLVGETASGKSAMAIELAKQFNGEIIAADSRTVYSGMDVGTAKPSTVDMQGVEHHLLDVISPDEPYTVATFKRQASRAMSQISDRGHIPFIVGGTGLYVDAVIFDYVFQGKPNLELRARLQHMSVEELQAEITEKGIEMPTNARNPRHLMRALESEGLKKQDLRLRDDTLVLGLSIDRELLKQRIAERVDRMMERGYVEELRGLVERHGWDAPGLQSPGHKAFRRYFDGELSFEEAKAALVREHISLAKRQRTWFKRNKSIHWLCKKEEAVDLITTFLNKVSTAA